jgi:hypothetical protein
MAGEDAPCSLIWSMPSGTSRPAFERLLEALPRSGPVDLAQESAKILGRNPFVEHQDRRR